MAVETFNDIRIVFFRDGSTWERWLSEHYELQEGVWIKMAKKSSGITSVTYAEALDVALCYGWIDGQKRSYDETYFLQKFTPRRKRSMWSKVNIGHVQRLVDAGNMKPSGQAAVDVAKADGRWEQAYDSPKNATVPPELQTALDGNKKAQEFFETLSKTNRYACIWRVATARTDKTKQSRVEVIIAMLEAGQTYH